MRTPHLTGNKLKLWEGRVADMVMAAFTFLRRYNRGRHTVSTGERLVPNGVVEQNVCSAADTL